MEEGKRRRYVKVLPIPILGEKPYYPENHGFDINIAGCDWGLPKDGYFHPWNIDTLDDKIGDDYLTDRLTDEAVKYIKGQKEEEPFFLYLSYYAVHIPIQAKKKQKAKFGKKIGYIPEENEHQISRVKILEQYSGRVDPQMKQINATYAAMVYNLDQCVGRVLKSIKDQGLEDNTIVIFTSDNGGLSHKFGEHINITDNSPLRGGKGSAYEGGVRVPLIIKWPDVVSTNSICTEPVSTIDFYPTMLDICNVQAKDSKVDGQSILPLLKNPGNSIDRNELYWHYPHYHPGGKSPYSSVLSQDWKLIKFYEKNQIELYNLKEDIGEQHNLAASHPQKKYELIQLLNNWLSEVDAQLPLPNPDYRPGPLSKNQAQWW